MYMIPSVEIILYNWTTALLSCLTFSGTLTTLPQPDLSDNVLIAL